MLYFISRQADGDGRDTKLALLQVYGSNAWRIHNYLNGATAEKVEQGLEELKNLTAEVNRDRKSQQVRRAQRHAPGLPY